MDSHDQILGQSGIVESAISLNLEPDRHELDGTAIDSGSTSTNPVGKYTLAGFHVFEHLKVDINYIFIVTAATYLGMVLLFIVIYYHSLPALVIVRQRFRTT